MHTLLLRAPLHLARIIEDMPFPLIFRFRVQRLVLHRMCWKTPLQVSPLLAHFSNTTELSVTSFTTVNYDTNLHFTFVPVPRLQVRRFQWTSAAENKSDNLLLRRTMRMQIANAFSQALLPTGPSILEISDHTPTIFSHLTRVWEQMLQDVKISIMVADDERSTNSWGAGD